MRIVFVEKSRAIIPELALHHQRVRKLRLLLPCTDDNMTFPSALLLLMVPCIVSATQTTGLILEGVDPAIGYHAIVKENEKTVEVTPEIKVVGGLVSKFRLTSKYPGEVPFRVFIPDRTSGAAIMVAAMELDCEKRKSYKFDLVAIGLSGKISDNVTVHLSVEDVNEFAPKFLQNSYTVDVDEERLYDTIVQVEARDDDCTPKYSDICKYEILDPHQPFTINFEGRIKNTEPLSWEQNPTYVLSVVAYDCGMKRSEPTTVNIKVNKVCHLGWK
ncbi:calsyntenin-1-like, partial [Limulus polyphemus]|uniref:Calsyntenin-1-like n=1 Tax=Limulus polyphemus TaxID=6850 RepID=A0ABM1BW96_LIMPO